MVTMWSIYQDERYYKTKYIVIEIIVQLIAVVVVVVVVVVVIAVKYSYSYYYYCNMLVSTNGPTETDTYGCFTRLYNVIEQKNLKEMCSIYIYNIT